MKATTAKTAKYRNWTVSQLRQEATTLAQENDLLRAKLEQAKAAWQDGYAAALEDLADGIAHWEQFGVDDRFLRGATALVEASSAGWYCDHQDHAAPSCRKRQAPDWLKRFDFVKGDVVRARP